jgi:CheY-like chemotaxis protein
MKRILLVDDSRVTRELIKVYLIAKDVELQEAPDGAEALRMIRARPPDLVLADLRMPRLDGFELCQALQADPRLRKVPVLILTSSRDAGVEERLKGAGALQVLQKPIQPQPLQEAIQKHILSPGVPS